MWCLPPPLPFFTVVWLQKELGQRETGESDALLDALHHCPLLFVEPPAAHTASSTKRSRTVLPMAKIIKVRAARFHLFTSCQMFNLPNVLDMYDTCDAAMLVSHP
jgi:hypothetical protein